jgi:hypothetical protein
MPNDNILDPQDGANQNVITQGAGEVVTPGTDGTTTTINTDPNGSGQTAPSQGDLDYKTRWQASSEEGRKLFEKNQALAKEVEDMKNAVTGFVSSDRQILEKYLVSNGVTEDEKQKYLSAYDAQNPVQQVPAQQQPQKPATQVPTTPSLDPFEQIVLHDAAGKLKTQYENRQMATQRFLEDTSNRSLSKETLNAIWPLAFKLETESHLDPVSAISRAKAIVVGQDEIEDRGYARGISDMLLGGMSSGVVGGSSESQAHDRLPAQHEAFIKAHIESEKLTGNAAEDFRKRYVERLASKNLI